MDKVPVVTADDLDSTSMYPRTGGIRCIVVQRSQESSGRELVKVSIDYPDHLETTEGLRAVTSSRARIEDS